LKCCHDTVVVYVHGLWLTGIEGSFLRRRLGNDLQAETFALDTRPSPPTSAPMPAPWGSFLAAWRADTLHLVGHSLGGVVIRKFFEMGEGARLPPDVCLHGLALNGSRAARTSCGLLSVNCW